MKLVKPESTKGIYNYVFASFDSYVMKEGIRSPNYDAATSVCVLDTDKDFLDPSDPDEGFGVDKLSRMDWDNATEEVRRKYLDTCCEIWDVIRCGEIGFRARSRQSMWGVEV